MESLHAYIHEARARHLTDEQIRQLLLDGGWHETQIAAGLAGLTMPVPPPIAEASAPKASLRAANRPHDLHPLEAALHHILLWVFTGSSTITLAIVSYALYGTGSTGQLASFVVIGLITFIPFCALYLHYLNKVLHDRRMTTGRIWSIITIVLHSIGLLASTIVLILSLLLLHSQPARSAVITASAVTAILNALVVATYCVANFTPKFSFRSWILQGFPIAMLTVLVIFSGVCIPHFNVAKNLEAEQQALVTITSNVKDYVSQHNALPSSLNGIYNTDNSYNVTYRVKNSSSYLLCADFSKAEGGYDNTDIYDTYVRKGDFESAVAGQNCWTVNSDTLYTTAERSGSYTN